MFKPTVEVAVFTGSSGIGLATAKRFVDEGLYVFIIGRRQSESDKAKVGARAMYASMTPLGRIGRADEMANAALFLASDESSFSTGMDLSTDGGVAQI